MNPLSRTPPERTRADALLVGFAAGLRSTAPAAALALRRDLDGAARIGALVAAAGELATDKTPVVPDRTGAPALAGRIAAGAWAGHRIAGASGLVPGALGAVAGTFAGFRARNVATTEAGLPDPAVAVVEDAVALGLAGIATRGR